MSLKPRSPHQNHDSCHNVSHWPGPLMVKHCTLVTPTTSFVSGKCPWLDKLPMVYVLGCLLMWKPADYFAQMNRMPNKMKKFEFKLLISYF